MTCMSVDSNVAAENSCQRSHGTGTETAHHTIDRAQPRASQHDVIPNDEQHMQRKRSE